MFHDWDNYYLLVGSAAAALIGLLFVVATLSGSRDQEGAVSASDVFITPVVFHFGVVVVLSGLALSPGVAASVAGLGVGVAAACGLVYAAVTVARLRRRDTAGPHWSDFWFYGVAPLVIYLLMAGVSAALATASRGSAAALAAVLMLLLVVSVRNAWDLVSYLAPRKNAGGAAS